MLVILLFIRPWAESRRTISRCSGSAGYPGVGSSQWVDDPTVMLAALAAWPGSDRIWRADGAGLCLCPQMRVENTDTDHHVSMNLSPLAPRCVAEGADPKSRSSNEVAQ